MRAIARSTAEQFEWAYAATSDFAARLGETAYRRLACRFRSFSTHFSGLRTVDVVLAMSKAASPATLRGTHTAEVVSSHEQSQALLALLGSRSDGCLFANFGLTAERMERPVSRTRVCARKTSQNVVSDGQSWRCQGHRAGHGPG